MTHAPITFGAILRQMRTAAALSQMALAERAGLSPRGISDLERGARRTPHLATVRLLADALALSPADRQALLAAARPGTPTQPRSAPSPWQGPAVELLERETNLVLLAEHFQHAAAGYGRVVFVAGEAGFGKTVLINAFSRQISDRATVLRASCDALSTPAPLGPLRDLAGALGLPLQPHLADVEGRDHLFRAVLDAFTIRKGPTVLVAEDAHWADGATIELVRFLARRISDSPLLIIVTYRDDEIGGDHPLRLLLGDLATAATVHRQQLTPLSEAAVRHLARGSARDGETLHLLTGGNPFFVTEVLASGGLDVPVSVGDAVLARAARLSPEARAMLDLAAVIGATVDSDLLLAVAGPVFDEADEGVARGLLHWDDNNLNFRHALAREAILAAIPPPRRRLLHARVLEALRNEPEAARDLPLLAHHAEGAGDRTAILTFSIAAAEQAAALHAPHEATAQYARALRFAGGLPAAERARLFEGHSVACYMIDRGEEAIAARRDALALWREIGDAPKEGENLRWLARFYWLQGRGSEAEAAAAAALDVLVRLPPGPELAMTYTILSQLRMLDNDLEGTLLWGNRAIALAKHLGATETLVHALITIGSVQDLFGQAQGREDLTQGLRLALDHGLHEAAGRALTNLAWSAMWALQLDEAERAFATAIAFAVEHDQDYRHAYLLAGRAALRLQQGAWGVAEEDIQRLLQQPSLGTVTRIVALTTQGQLCARRGEPEATSLLDDALELAERSRQLMRLGPVRAARAEAALLAGDAAQALAEIHAVRDVVFARGNRWLRSEFAWLLWQADVPDIPIDNLAPPFTLQISGDVVRASAAWQDLGYPYEEARALAASDDPEHVQRAITIFEQLGAQPALVQAIGHLRALGVCDMPAQHRLHKRQGATTEVGCW